MSRIRLSVKIENQTSERLRRIESTTMWGEWTNPWQPPADIEPGATAEFRAEGDAAVGVPVTGTEGRVVYAIGGDESRQLYVHFNSATVESQYGNTFHVWGPRDFDVHSTGGQGHHAALKVALRPTRKVRVPNFLPSFCGLHFKNTWSQDLVVVSVGTLWNKLCDQLPSDVKQAFGIAPIDPDFLPFTRADAGLCGGMVYAVMDYHAARLLPPVNDVTPSNAADEMFTHIRDRLIDSFDIVGRGHRFLTYSSPTYPNGDEGAVQALGLWFGRSWVTYREEWPKIRDDIDAGRLSPVALIQTDEFDIGKNHQVLAYAYRRSGQQVELWIYDPNLPDENDVRLMFDVTDTTGEVHMRRLVAGEQTEAKRIWCMFRIDGYTAHTPPNGRPATAITLRDALERSTERRSGRLTTDIPGLTRPASLRGWMTSL